MPELYELSLSRYIDAPPMTVWKAFVDHGQAWFTPRPWTTALFHYDLYPGGKANVVMRSPEGEEYSYNGVILDVEIGRLIVSTGAMTEDWVPQAGDMHFVRIDRFEPEGQGTRYTAHARHWDEKAMRQHAEMGFEQGWNMATDQLAEVALSLAAED